MYHHGVADSTTITVGLKDEEIMKDILESSELQLELIKSIQSEGVRDAIYVIPQRFGRVIEGNRRTRKKVVMRKLAAEGYFNPKKPHLDFTVNSSSSSSRGY